MRLPTIEISTTGENVLVSITPPPGTERASCDICAVIDISGSMSAEATLKDEPGRAEVFGLSLLDVVKHSVKTIIHVLGDNDRLALVSFSDNARVELELIQMDAAGKRRALAALARLHPEGSTNLWAGLHNGLEVLRTGVGVPNAARQCMLFTDGCPNVIPPRGHLPMLKKYEDQHDGLPCSIQTFGFGYSLDSPLLEKLAIAGHGLYAFIPDCSLVGSMFVNALSNLQTTISTSMKISLEVMNGAVIEDCLGGFLVKKASWGMQIQPGSLHFGQTRDVVLRMAEFPADAQAPFLTVHVELPGAPGTEPIRVTAESGPRVEPTDDQRRSTEVNIFRLKLVDALRSITEMATRGRMDPARALVTELSEEITAAGMEDDPSAGEFFKDLSGQVTEALSRNDWWTKWGRHYLPSLCRAHMLQQCNNFKDFGVQTYGGELFTELRDSGEKIFMDIPPPKGSINRSTPAPTYGGGGGGGYRGRSASPPSPLPNMGRFMNAYGGCIAPWSLVHMSDGQKKRVENIRVGDRVVVGRDAAGEIHGEVSCVVKTLCTRASIDLVELENGPWMTPWHPVRLPGEKAWQFPVNIGKHHHSVSCDAVYSFVMKDCASGMVIDGTECVSLGHGMDEDVVRHSYLGTSAVIKDLSGLRGWSSGEVVLKSEWSFLRNKETGLLCGLRQ